MRSSATGHEEGDETERLADELTGIVKSHVAQLAEHCDSCIQQTMRGWVGIGDLVPVGQRQCKMNCLCRMEFRREPSPR